MKVLLSEEQRQALADVCAEYLWDERPVTVRPGPDSVVWKGLESCGYVDRINYDSDDPLYKLTWDGLIIGYKKLAQDAHSVDK